MRSFLLPAFLLTLGCGVRTGLNVDSREQGGSGGTASGSGGSTTSSGSGGVPEQGCSLGDIHVLLDAEPLPVVSYSFSTFGDSGDYLVAYTTGWNQDVDGEMAIVSSDVAQLSDQQRIGGQAVRAAANDPLNPALTATLEERRSNDWVRARWAHGDTGFVHLEEEPVCFSCTPGNPAIGMNAGRIAVALQPLDGGAGLDVSQQNGGGASTIWAGSGTPRVFSEGESLAFVYARPEGGTWLRRVDWNTDDIDEAHLSSDFGDVVAALADDDLQLVALDPATEIVRLMPFNFLEGAGVAWEVASGLGPIVGVAAARANGRTAFVIRGLQDFFVAVYDNETHALVLGPEVLTRVAGVQGPVLIQPHPQGFAIVYGGWEPVANYALYGRLMLCAPL